MNIPRPPKIVSYDGPVIQTDRIIPIDVLRGFAVLGILIMNIQAFSMIGAVYLNPTAYGDLHGLNYVVWLLSHLFADSKFMTIFSLLFGAGIVLMSDRMEATGRKPAPVHYRRTVILLIIGLAHAWLLWTGDILYAYAMCGFLVFLFRRRKPKTLIISGFAVVAFGSLLALLFQWSMQFWPVEQVEMMVPWWSPEPAATAAELEAYRGNWSSQNAYRFPVAMIMQTSAFLTTNLWRAGGLMLAGMGLFKLGVFNATLQPKAYRIMVLLAVLVGIPVILLGISYASATDWSFETGFFGGKQFNYWGSLFVSFGWIGLVMLGCQRSSGGWLYRSLAATGQMALTNYLMQTIICTSIFYGHGLGMFGRIERAGQIAIVFAVWAFQLTISPWWLKRFRFGPFEWLWRSLTYMKLQPMRRV